MKKLLCPQCKIASFYVLNSKGERRLVYVDQDYVVHPRHEAESLDDFDLSIVYCLGCSWKGSPQRLLKRANL